MIDYSLAKKLEDAGFRRKGFGGSEIRAMLGDDATKGDIVRSIMLTDLSELIEACGDRFFELTQRKERWSARAIQRTGKPLPHHNGSKFLIYASTPEEAVANLYLALNPQ